MGKIRDSRYDLLRVIAMGFVLLIHSIDSVQIGQSGLKSIFETDFKRHSEPRLPSTAQINH